MNFLRWDLLGLYQNACGGLNEIKRKYNVNYIDIALNASIHWKSEQIELKQNVYAHNKDWKDT